MHNKYDDKRGRIIKSIMMIMKQYRLEKNGIDEPICKAEIKTHIQRLNGQILRGDGGKWVGLGDWD